MSIERLEGIEKKYFNRENNQMNLMDYFMQTVIDTFKEHSDMIAELRKEVAKVKEKDNIDYKNIKVGETD